MAEISVDLHVRLVRRGMVYPAALLCFLLRPVELGSESLTADAPYPSPVGVYSELRSIRSSYFAYSSGNVGIGTTGPSAKLTVNGNSSVAGTLAVNGAVFGSGNELRIIGNGIVQFASLNADPPGQPGMIYYNTSTGFRGYRGGATPGWYPLGGGTLQSTWATPCPAGYVNTQLYDCDSVPPSREVNEESCSGGGAGFLCLRVL